ncbi:adenosylmethionine--8-amino-7-oxononanoate transaminase [Pelosinus fermentans]|uniref:Adenosylmethionine-8-amino-7-oxononanoate aminotransferase n=1 Tax=Pelosinus fermentans JBW45 TaxID=1192197 RepID=I8TSD7_9FIRM|nr:adenosylmethionine--8-amino-7-oxononanoate transaminase [Pelosinus fermentans]AJQ26144.1 adenosylmethionine--8-amino-7-oxononanoate aminotransferase [Pelosinus fermentans JBW45]
MSSIEEKDKEFIWHPFTQMQEWVAQPQMVIEAAEGIKLIDDQGNSYYDGVSSLWVNLHGHRHPVIDQAIIEQLGKVAHTTMLGLVNVPAAQLAEELMAVVPQGLKKLFYSDDGSTAVEIGIKMAFQYWQLKGKPKKQKFITLANAYHGDTVGTVSVGGIDLFHRIFSALLFETIQAPAPCCYHCKLSSGAELCGMACSKEVEKILEEGHEEIAAIIVEPLVQAAAGMLTQPPGYLKRLREITKKYNVLLLVDEVATGFGRTGKMFACDHEEVSPDFMMVAKGITGGYLPLAATFMTDEIYNAFLGDYAQQRTFYHGHSYTGNPLCCAAGLANLKIFRDENVLENLQGKIEAARNKLAGFTLKHVGDIRQRGLMIGIELVENPQEKIPFPWEMAVGAKVCKRAREHGLIIRPIGSVVVFMPPLASTITEIEHMLDIIYLSIKEVTEDEQLQYGARDVAAVMI